MVSGDILAEERSAADELFALAQPAEAATRAAASESTPLRQRLLLDNGWRFAFGNASDPDKDFGFGKLNGDGTFAKAETRGGPIALRFDDSKWRTLDLPHDWAVELPFVNDKALIGHGAKPIGREFPDTSVGWYRRQFILPAEDADRRISVRFDGIFRNAMIFFNGHYMATHMSGYVPSPST